jgi:hypothetical protein
MPSNNPYSIGYGAIWTAFNAWAPWTAFFRPGATTQVNQQTPSFQPIAPNASQPGDRASFKLLERALAINLYKRNSLTVLLPATYTLILDSGTYGPDAMNAASVISWQAIDAFDKTQKIGLGNLLYDWEPLDAAARARDSQSKRPEWSAVWGIKMVFQMPRDVFRSTNFT